MNTTATRATRPTKAPRANHTTEATTEQRERKPNPRREELKALSQSLKMIARETEDGGTVNQLLKDYYFEQGAKELKTFDQWKEEGYFVRKGSKSYMVWSKPLSKENAAKEATEEELQELKEGKKLFGICHLFDISQVKRIEETQQATA